MITQENRPKTFSEVAGQEDNKRLLKAILKDLEAAPRSLIFEGSFGCGKCLMPSTRVQTERGYVPIGSLMDNPEEGFNPLEVKVSTRNGVKISSHLYFEKNCKVNVFILDNGMKINGTDKHRVLSIRDGVLDLIPVALLKEGDRVYLSTNAFHWNNGFEETATDESLIRAYYTGFFLGDGWVGEQSNGTLVYGFVGSYEKLSMAKLRLGVTTKVVVSNRGLDNCTLRVHPKDWKLFPFSKVNAYTKSIPEEVFSYSLKEKGAFIAGLVDTDGHVRKRGGIDVTLASEQLIDQLQELLISVGIDSAKSKRMILYKGERRPFYRLCTYAYQNQMLHDLIDSELYLKSGNLNIEDSRNIRNIYSFSEDETCNILTQVKTHRKQSIYKKQDLGFQLIQNLKLNSALTERTISNYRNHYGSVPDCLSQFEGYSEHKIVSKEEVVSDVYDLTIPDGAEFMAQGLANHNSTLARIFARAINCEKAKKPPFEPCGECKSCSYSLETSPYYSELDAAVVGNVESVRNLRDSFFSTVSTGYRVICFDEAHMISSAAMNSLLKVVEEVPERLFFLFATTEVNKLLPTLRSRSLELQFENIAFDKIIENLQSICALKSIQVSDDTLGVIARLSKGHMRSAHMLLEKLILLGEEDFIKTVKEPYPLYVDFFTHISDSLKRTEILESLSEFPLSLLRSDFDRFLFDLVTAFTTLSDYDSDHPLHPLAKSLGVNVFRIVKFGCESWFRNAFENDYTFRSAMLTYPIALGLTNSGASSSAANASQSTSAASSIYKNTGKRR